MRRGRTEACGDEARARLRRHSPVRRRPISIAASHWQPVRQRAPHRHPPALPGLRCARRDGTGPHDVRPESSLAGNARARPARPDCAIRLHALVRGGRPVKRLAALLALACGISGCSWTLRHLWPDCNNNPCQDVCGCRFCCPGDPPQNGCVPPPAQGGPQ